MKTIILYIRRNTGLVAFLFLTGRAGITNARFKIITDDESILYWCRLLDYEVVTISELGEYDWLFCVHGDKVIPETLLKEKRCINFHPCLNLYRGKDPISRYILNENTEASVDSHYMIKEVDAGEIIHSEKFKTPKCKSHAEFYNVALEYYLRCFDETLSKLGL